MEPAEGKFEVEFEIAPAEYRLDVPLGERRQDRCHAER